jgi:hypothetical protein
MMKPLIVLAALLGIPAGAAEFAAYYTRLGTPPPAPVYVDKYADLVVTLADGNRLEFARANAYLPQWRTTTGGLHSVENLFPGTDADPDLYYSYVRLVESGPEEIVVHWRHFKDIESITMSKQQGPVPDSLNPHGITGVIHELFTIHPDGTVEREVRDAANTRYQDWLDPRLVTRQNLTLTGGGITHGPVIPGQKPPFYPRPAVTGNPLKTSSGLPAPVAHWNFDEGLAPHEDQVQESLTDTGCEISGLMTRFKKGVSGTALALDGYYTGVAMPTGADSGQTMTVEAWVALDAYPYSTAPLVHHSKGLNAAGTAITEGWYLGIDATGHPTFKVKLDGIAAKSVTATAEVLPLYEWTHVCATVGGGNIRLYVNGAKKVATSYSPNTASVGSPSTPLLLGRNNEMLKTTYPVRPDGSKWGVNRNLAFVYGIQGLLDEVSVYGAAFDAGQVATAHTALLPADRTSDLAKGVLPGQVGVAPEFGATYQSLAFSEVWDPLWRDLPGTEIVVKFDKNPCSVVYWRGTNFAPNWVTENNRWMADQSSEGGSGVANDVGASEHMADKQTRHCRARIIENTPARVVIHWRYPCVGVSYLNLFPAEWSDEYHTIYPDGTGVRKVVWDKGTGTPGFQDIQFLTNPGEVPLDVMDLQALTVMDLAGATADLTWALPQVVPDNPLADTALVELLHSKGSVHKVFAMFQGGEIEPWGENNNVIIDPFAGPWNHWPMSLCPSDGRFAVASDRVTHFALAANDGVKNSDGMSLVLYGFSNKTGFANNQQQIASLLPLYKSWKQPPGITALSGCTASAYDKETRCFPLVATQATMSVRVNASAANPVVNPCFTVRNWGGSGAAVVETTGAVASDVRQGTIIDTDGTRTLVVWVELNAAASVDVAISGASF